MKHVLVFTLHDTNGNMLLHLDKITPTLKKEFDKAVVSVSAMTAELFKVKIDKIKKNKFFDIVYSIRGQGFGQDFYTAFKQAVKVAKKDDTLHLATLDRLAYILETKHKTQFLKDVKSQSNKLPLMFTRSKKAWETYPKNYYAIEQITANLGETLFNKKLDFAWCHFILKQQTLRDALSGFVKKDNSLFGELVTILIDMQINTKEVDWLDWEDPYILKTDAEKLKLQREGDDEENAKRLSYTIPTIHLILERYSQHET